MINQGDEQETTTTVGLLNQIKPNTKFDTGNFFQEPTFLKDLNFPAKNQIQIFLPKTKFEFSRQKPSLHLAIRTENVTTKGLAVANK